MVDVLQPDPNQKEQEQGEPKKVAYGERSWRDTSSNGEDYNPEHQPRPWNKPQAQDNSEQKPQ